MRLKNTAIAREILHKEFGEPFFPRSVVDKVDAFLLGINIGKKSAAKHEVWLEGNNEVEYVCSRCGAADYSRSPYCWNCGAKMDGK